MPVVPPESGPTPHRPLPLNVAPLEYDATPPLPVPTAAWYAFGTVGSLAVSIGVGSAVFAIAQMAGFREDPSAFLGFGIAALLFGLMLMALPLVRCRVLVGRRSNF